MSNRPGHDRRYAIDAAKITAELGWKPRHSFEQGLEATVRWTLDHQGWCQRVREQGGYGGGRLGVLAAAGAN
jgi:dTDP-glucose 4,6-dehydratase